MDKEVKKRKSNNPDGRPHIGIKKEEFEKLCALQCTQEEIANFYNCTIVTVVNWCYETYGTNFQQAYERFSVNGKMSLRRYQFKLAEDNPTMAIWLGKQYLGQKDRQDVDINANIPSDGLFKALQQGLVDNKQDD